MNHDALIYADEEEFLAGTVPYLREGLEAGDAEMVAIESAKAELLRAELGADGAGVFYADLEELGRNPARAIPFWREFLDECGGRPVRGIAEAIRPGQGPPEIDEGQRHESLLNVAFGPSPMSLLCPYDGGALADQVLENVVDSHQHVARDGVAEPGRSSAAEDHWFAGSLVSAPATAEAIEFGLEDLAPVRRRVERVAASAGLAALHVSDLAVAASELAANSVAHGGGRGTLRTWVEKDRVLVEVTDRGHISEPLVGRIRPRITQEGGRGLWLVNQLCDLVQIRSGPGGTAVRLHMGTV